MQCIEYIFFVQTTFNMLMLRILNNTCCYAFSMICVTSFIRAVNRIQKLVTPSPDDDDDVKYESKSLGQDKWWSKWCP